MTALQTEALTTDELTKVARDQIDAFNKGDWEQMRALLTSDARYHEFGTERKIEARPDHRAVQGLEDCLPGRRRHRDKLRRQRQHGGSRGDLEGHAHRPARDRGRNDSGLGQAPGDTRRRLLRLRGRQDQGKPPLLRRDDTAQADRRRAQVAGGPRGTAAQAVGPLRRRFDRRHMSATPRY